MTKQEALQELMDLSIDYGNRTAEEIERLDEAVDMAIKALRADAVSRQAAIDVISRIGLCKCSTKEVQAYTRRRI